MKTTITDPTQAGSAILAWAVQGCGRWLADGLGEPEKVMQATEAYRQSQQLLADFVADCCVVDDAGVVDKKHTVPAQYLRDEYENWCRSKASSTPFAARRGGRRSEASAVPIGAPSPPGANA